VVNQVDPEGAAQQNRAALQARICVRGKAQPANQQVQYSSSSVRVGNRIGAVAAVAAAVVQAEP